MSIVAKTGRRTQISASFCMTFLYAKWDIWDIWDIWDLWDKSHMSHMSHMSHNIYHGRVSPRWKYPPVGPSSGSSAKATAVFAPSSTSSGARSVPISVFTQPGSAEFTLTFVPSSLRAVVTVSMFNAAFEEQYADAANSGGNLFGSPIIVIDPILLE